MLKKSSFTAVVSFSLLLFLLWGEYADGAVGNASATIHYGTNPVDHFSSVILHDLGGGEVTIDVKLPGYTQFYLLSRPLGFMPGWLASKAQDSNDVTVTSPEGLQYIYPEDANHVLTEIKTPYDVNIVVFDYNDTDANLIDTQSDGYDANLSIEYEYETVGGTVRLKMLSAWDDDDLREFTLDYDDANRVIAISGSCESCGGGGGFQYEYDVNDLVTKVRDATDPNVVIYEYEYENSWVTDIYLGEANDNNHVQKFEYTDTGGGSYIVDIYDYVDANNYRLTTEYKNSAGVVTKRIRYEDPNEDPDNPAGDSFVEHIVYFYDANNVVTKKVVIPPLGDSGDPPDPNSGIRKEYTYDPNTCRLKTEKWFDANNVALTVSEYEYDYIPDPCGNILNVRVEYYKDIRGEKTEYFYDGNDVDPNLKVMPEVTAGISATQLKHEYEYDPNRGRLTLEKQLHYSGGQLIQTVQTKYEYDNYGNLTKRYDDYQGSNEETTEYIYTGFNEMTRMKLPSGVVSGKSYNDNGKLVSEFVLADGDDIDLDEPNLISQTNYTYDDMGWVKTITRAKADDVFDFNDPGDWILTEYDYDLWDRRTKVIEDANTTNGLQLVTTYEYNNQGEVVKVTLPNGKWTKTYRDGRGLVIKTEVGHDSTVVATTEFDYDANGNLIWETAPDGTRTKYEYDDFDRLSKVTRGL